MGFFCGCDCFPARYVRVPQAAQDAIAVPAAIEELGWKTISYNVDSRDSTLSTDTDIAAHVLSELATLNGSSVVSRHHDLSSQSVDAIAAIVHGARAAGYTLVSLDRCLYGNTTSTPVPVAFATVGCANTSSTEVNLNCTVSAWSDWSRCSSACGGTATRSRVVLVPATGTGVCPYELSQSTTCSAACPYVDVQLWWAGL